MLRFRNNTWNYGYTPSYVFIALCLIKLRDNFTFTSPLSVQLDQRVCTFVSYHR